MKLPSVKTIFKKLIARPLPWFLGCTGALLYLRLFHLPKTPIFMVGFDQWMFLADSWRMFTGATIYKDFFQVTTPGTSLIYLALFKLFGVRAWIPNAMMILIGLTFAWLIVVISRKLLPGPIAYLPGALFVALSLLNAINVTHHWYSALAVMAAVAVAMDARSPFRLAGAGFLCGLAAFFTQTTGAMAALGFCAFLAWECCHRGQNWRWFLAHAGRLLAVFLATVVALNAYFIWKAGLTQFLACTVGFAVSGYGAYPWNNLLTYMQPWPRVSHWYSLHLLGAWVLIHALLPLIFPLFFARYRHEARRRPEEPWDRLILLNVVVLSLFASVAPAPSFFRLCMVPLPPALIVLVWFVRSPQPSFRCLRAYLWFGAVALIAGKTIAWQAQSTQYATVPSGRICLRPAASPTASYEILQWLARVTHPSEYFFDFGSEVELYSLLELKNPTRVSLLTPTEYTQPDVVRGVVDALERHRVRYILCPATFDYEEIEFSLPPSVNHLGPFLEYLRTHYHVVKTFVDSDQVWERNMPPG